MPLPNSQCIMNCVIIKDNLNDTYFNISPFGEISQITNKKVYTWMHTFPTRPSKCVEQLYQLASSPVAATESKI